MKPKRDWSEASWSRLYHSLSGDPKFAEIFDDDAAFAAYCRMLMLADQSYPHPAQIPAGCQPEAVRLLSSKGIIKVVGQRFYVAALVKEREARSERARAAARSRWDADALHQQRISNADGMLVTGTGTERGVRERVKQQRLNGTTNGDPSRAQAVGRARSRGMEKIAETPAFRNWQMHAKKS